MTEVLEREQPAMTGEEPPPCEAIVDFLGTPVPCIYPAAGVYRRVCACGHAREGRLCAVHAEHTANAACLACSELPDGEAHDCPVTISPAEGRA